MRFVMICSLTLFACHAEDAECGKWIAARDEVVSPTRTQLSDLGASGALGEQALIHDGDAVFFIGNSFFGWGDRPLPQWVTALGMVQQPPIRIETGSDILFGNTQLAAFLRHEATQQALASRRYKVFVLQAEEFEPVDHKAEFHQAVRDFHNAITAAGAKTALFMTWDFRFRPFLDELSRSYEEIGAELKIPVIPVGLVYKDYRCQPFQHHTGHWLTADAQHPHGGVHQNAMGTAVNTYATFQLLTGIDPLGSNFQAPGNSNDDASMEYFSAMAWKRVRPRLPNSVK